MYLLNFQFSFNECIRAVLQNSDVRQMYLNAQSEWLNHISVSTTLLLHHL